MNLSSTAYRAGSPDAADSVPAERHESCAIDEAATPAIAQINEMIAMGHLQEAAEKLSGTFTTNDMPVVRKRRRGRPRGRRYAQVTITLEDELLERLDKLADDLNTSRSGAIREALSKSPSIESTNG